MLRCLFAIVFLAFGTPAWAGYDIILIAGQSNAVGLGVGPFVGINETLDREVKQVGRFSADDKQLIRISQLVNGVRYSALQFWTYNPRRHTVGFGPTFARQYAKWVMPKRRRLLLIPAARGATSVFEWLGEMERWPESKYLYPDAIARVKYAMGLMPDSRVVAILWHQLEAEINFILRHQENMTGKKYRNGLIRLFRRFRHDLPGDYPIITAPSVPSWRAGTLAKQRIEYAQRLAVAADTKAGIASVAGLISNHQAIGNGDEIHFSAESQVRLGNRMFLAYQNLMQ